MRIAVITGASSGMGEEFAKQIDEKCLGLDELWLIARREEPMLQLSKGLRHKVRIFAMDLTDDSSYLSLLKTLEIEQPQIRLLIHCAGFGIAKNVLDTALADLRGMIDLNCKASTTLTYHLLPFMSKRSYILQAGSAAAFMPQPGFAVYAATKAYVLSFSKALRMELKEKEIYVTTMCPGPVKTPFFNRSTQGDIPAFKERFMANKEKVVAKALKDTFAKKEVSVYGTAMQLLFVITKVFPHWLLLSIYDRIRSLYE